MSIMHRKNTLLANTLLLITAFGTSPVIAQRNPDIRLDADMGLTARPSDPRMAASGDSVYVTWIASGNVYFNRSLDGGATWLGSDIQLGSAAASAVRPQIAASGDSVFVTWEDHRRGFQNIYFNRSLDAGVTWLANDIELTTRGAQAPQILADGDSVYLAWGDFRNITNVLVSDIYFNRSLDGGTTWLSSDVRLDTDLPGTADSPFPAIDRSGNSIYVTWADTRNGARDIYLNRSLDGGATWLASDIRLDTNTPGASGSFDPKIAASGDSVYVTWTDGRSGVGDIYVNCSQDQAATWLTSDTRLDTDSSAATSFDPQISAFADSVYVIWVDQRNANEHIYFNRSLDDGISWLSSDTLLSSSPGGESPQIVASGDSVYVTWNDDRAGQVKDIHFNRSLDNGASWLPADIQLDSTAGPDADSITPQIVASGDSVYVAWADLRHDGSVYFNIPFGALPYGQGTSGSGGMVPILEGTDSLTLGSTFTLTVRDARGGALGAVIMGCSHSRTSIPFAGGTLLVYPISRSRLVLLDGTPGVSGDGTTTIQVLVPLLPSNLGLTFNFQAAFIDPSATEGLVLTNAVETWLL